MAQDSNAYATTVGLAMGTQGGLGIIAWTTAISSKKSHYIIWAVTPRSRVYQKLSGRNANLVSEQNLGRTPFPASVAASRDHEVTRRVKIQLRDNTRTMTRNDEERYGKILILLFVEVVQAQNVVGCAITKSVECKME